MLYQRLQQKPFWKTAPKIIQSACLFFHASGFTGLDHGSIEPQIVYNPADMLHESALQDYFPVVYGDAGDWTWTPLYAKHNLWTMESAINLTLIFSTHIDINILPIQCCFVYFILKNTAYAQQLCMCGIWMVMPLVDLLESMKIKKRIDKLTPIDCNRPIERVTKSGPKLLTG